MWNFGTWHFCVSTSALRQQQNKGYLVITESGELIIETKLEIATKNRGSADNYPEEFWPSKREKVSALGRSVRSELMSFLYR
ncbi:MAG TPA: hypothetical protein VE076_00215 [Nitrososphaeraceae archaeon]|nr:hypothetical protein [Nitrososphaeraceae archaeon]